MTARDDLFVDYMASTWKSTSMLYDKVERVFIAVRTGKRKMAETLNKPNELALVNRTRSG